MSRSIPVLLYHHVAPDREITPKGFEAQLRFLLDQGYRSLSMNDLVENVRKEKTIDERGFVVTFDDGYLDNWVYAFPVLKKLAVQATLFLVTERVESQSLARSIGMHLDTRMLEREQGGFLSWAEAKDMAASGLVTLGSHTRTHRHFVRRQPYENLEAELRISKAEIESQTGFACEHLAWPWGDYETEWLPLVKEIGYRSVVTTLAGANVPGGDPFQLKRLNVHRQSVGWLKSRLRWNASATAASMVGPFYGLDRRLKVWWNHESPYSHG